MAQFPTAMNGKQLWACGKIERLWDFLGGECRGNKIFFCDIFLSAYKCKT